MKKLFIVFALSLIITSISAQIFDKGEFRQYEPGFYHKVIMRDILGDDVYTLKNLVINEYFVMDYEDRIYPVDITRYRSFYHSIPISQGSSGTCWAYSATSYMESEANRISGVKVNISELYTVYWDYVDRARHFVQNKGTTYLSEGSEANAIKRVMKDYGMMPYDAYSGLKEGQNYNNHAEMFSEMETYLNNVKNNRFWDEKIIVDSIKRILDSYIGTPPDVFTYDGKKYSPQSFMTDYLQLRPNDYFSFMSTMEFNYNEKHELVEPDNWWHCTDYYNINLDDYMSIFHKAIESGYTISLCGDVSEAGHDARKEVGVIPSFDIPSEYINEDSRQFRLSNKTTTDDHCIHVVGYQKTGDAFWYLIKDSGSGAFDGRNKGYRFYHEDYIKLKMMNYLIHVDVARDLLDTIIK